MGHFERTIDVPYEIGAASRRFLHGRLNVLKRLPHVKHAHALGEGPPVDAFLLEVETPGGTKGHVAVELESNWREVYHWRIRTKKARFHDLPDGMPAFEGSMDMSEVGDGCRIVIALDIDGSEPGDPVVEGACDAAAEVIADEIPRHKHF